MNQEEIDLLAIDLVRSHAREIDALSVAEKLADLEIDDPDDDIARAVHDRAMSAHVEVSFDGE